MAIAAESKFHVLAVDDSLIDRKLIEKLLKTSYQVTTVDSGSKALEFLGLYGDDEQSNATNPPSVSPNNHQEVEVNLIITDYCMPGMTGYDLLKKVKESSSLRNIPVVIMSSENVPSRITRCLEEGAEEFFLKPVQLSDLNRLIPYMMKTKVKNQEQEHQETLHQESQHEVEDTESQSQALQPSEHQQPQSTSNQQQQQQPLTQPQQQHHHHQQQVSDNKRKVVEEGLSPDRTRPRYNGIATVS